MSKMYNSEQLVFATEDYALKTLSHLHSEKKFNIHVDVDKG